MMDKTKRAEVTGRPKVEKQTRHAKERLKERAIPEDALLAMRQGKAFILNGLQGKRYHVLKHKKYKWYIGVEAEGDLVTVYETRNAVTSLRNKTNDSQALESLKKINAYLDYVNSKKQHKYWGKRNSKAAKKKSKMEKKLDKYVRGVIDD